MYLDLEKAFDTVKHNVLLSKLENIGIKNVALKLIDSHLYHRTQFVNNNGTLSTKEFITCGLSQGTAPSPLLFNIHINDITSLTVNGELVCYADDTALSNR